MFSTSTHSTLVVEAATIRFPGEPPLARDLQNCCTDDSACGAAIENTLKKQTKVFPDFTVGFFPNLCSKRQGSDATVLLVPSPVYFEVIALKTTHLLNARPHIHTHI